MISHKYLLFVALVLILHNPLFRVEASLRKWFTDNICLPTSRLYRQIRIGWAKFTKSNEFHITGPFAEKLFLNDRIVPAIKDASKLADEKLCENNDPVVSKSRCRDVLQRKYFEKLRWSFDNKNSANTACVFADVYSSKHQITYKKLKVLRCPVKIDVASTGVKKSTNLGDSSGIIEEESNGQTLNIYFASALNKYREKKQSFLLMDDVKQGKGLERSEDSSRKTLRVKAFLFELNKTNSELSKPSNKEQSE